MDESYKIAPALSLKQNTFALDALGCSGDVSTVADTPGLALPAAHGHSQELSHLLQDRRSKSNLFCPPVTSGEGILRKNFRKTNLLLCSYLKYVKNYNPFTYKNKSRPQNVKFFFSSQFFYFERDTSKLRFLSCNRNFKNYGNLKSN